MRFQVNAGRVISEIIDEEAVMINLMTGNYYSLNESGAEVWGSIERGMSIEQIVDALSERHGTPSGEIEAAVRAIVDELQREELIVPVSDDGAGRALGADPQTRPPSDLPFDVPRLEKHTDMQDLILLDPVHEVGDEGWPHVKADAPTAAGDEASR